MKRSPQQNFTPRTLFTLAILTVSSTLSSALAKDVTFTIGYQKGGLLTLLKERGTLDTFKKDGITFAWQLFSAGPPLLEAARAGAVDFGTVGDSPGVFALAAGSPLKYVSIVQSSSKRSSALIVLDSSPIQKVSDLKGKKLALTRGSSAHYLSEKILEEAGLTLNDVELVPLLPPDARPAFQSGAVDAWTIWDPYLSIVSSAVKVRVLRDNDKLQPPNSYFLIPDAVSKNPDKVRALSILNRELAGVAKWANTHKSETIDLWQAELGLPREVLEQQVGNAIPYHYKPFDAGELVYLQKVADTFSKLGIIPSKLRLTSQNIFRIPTRVN